MLIKTLAIVLGVGVLGAGAVGAAIYFGFIPAFWMYEQPEHSARYYPSDSVAYAWMTLNPSGGQRRDMMQIWDRLNDIPSFRDVMEDWQELLEGETDIDFEQDVAPWIGPAISAAVMDIDTDADDLSLVDTALTVGVRDEDAAADFLDKWLDYLKDRHDADFDRESYGDFDVWVDEIGNSGSYALSRDLLIAASTEDALDDVLELVDGERRRTLASNENFIEAQSALPARRFASFYLDYERFADQFAQANGLGEWSEWECDLEAFESPEWMAASAGWADKSIAWDFVSSPTSASALQVAQVADVADMLPIDTLGFAALSFDPNLDNYREILKACKIEDLGEAYGIDVNYINDMVAEFGGNSDLDDESTLADGLDVALEIIDDITGIHPEEELLDYLDGDLIVAIRDFDFDLIQTNPEENAVDVVAMLSYLPNNKGNLEDTVEDIIDTTTGYALLEADYKRVDVGATDEARVFEIDGIGYSPGYVLHNGYLTAGTTTDALKAVVRRQNGNGESLSTSSEYIRAASLLPTNREFIAYIDLHQIISQVDRRDAGLTRDQYRTLEKSLSAVAMSGAYDDHGRFRLVLTLFPDD